MDTFKRSRYYDFCITIYWFDMTAQLKTVIDRMYAGGSTGFHFHQTALLLDAGACF